MSKCDYKETRESRRSQNTTEMPEQKFLYDDDDDFPTNSCRTRTCCTRFVHIFLSLQITSHFCNDSDIHTDTRSEHTFAAAKRFNIYTTRWRGLYTKRYLAATHRRIHKLEITICLTQFFFGFSVFLNLKRKKKRTRKRKARELFIQSGDGSNGQILHYTRRNTH